MPTIMPNEGAWKPNSALNIISQTIGSPCLLSTFFNQYHIFHTALYLTDFQPFTKLRFLPKESGSFPSLNSDFPLTKVPLYPN